MKKKTLLLFLCVVILFVSAAACSTQQQQKEPEKTDNTDATTTASIVKDETAFINAISENGTWIICTLNDIETDKELVVEGEFHDKGKAENDLYRKIALYTQDENRNVTNRFKLTAPKMTVRSPNTKIANGTFVGDIYVESNGFTLENTKVEGNVFFASQEYKDSFESDDSEVTGKTEIQQ
jgi:hypothetical protein